MYLISYNLHFLLSHLALHSSPLSDRGMAFSGGVLHEPLSDRGASKASSMNILTLRHYLEYMILSRYPVNEDICANLNSFTGE
jgi:hypothetical protein